MRLIGIFAALALTACSGETETASTGETTDTQTAADQLAAVEAVYQNDPNEYVDNFLLLDHEGRAHELYYYQDAPAIVIMIQGNGCPIVRNAWSDFKAVKDRFEGNGVKFYMLNANKQDTRHTVKAEADAFSYDIPVLKDETQLIAESLGVKRTAEVLVISPDDWSVVYRGPVNDRLDYGTQRAEANEAYLADALTAILAGEKPETRIRRSKGCIVNLPETARRAAHAQISYSEVIAPMLEKNCATCHEEGGIAPWAMTGHDMIEGFAPMIREVVRTKRMPPWSADPHIGAFSNARGLTLEEKQTLVHWIEAGAPRGDGPDPLATRVSHATDWPLGEPDLIIEAPSFDVPASGIVDYQFPTVLNPMDEDVWVSAVTVVPGDKTVVHHALVGSSEKVTKPGEGDYQDVFDNYLIGFVPGAESYIYPEDTGVFVKAGGEFRFQMHYTTSGRATTDTTRLGLYFHKSPPKFPLRQQVALNVALGIPPNTVDHQEQAYFEFDNPATLYMLFPHSHYRGKASTFDIVYPDGREETILSVPDYDFNWQHTYSLAEPIDVPKGARLIHRTLYDNTERNPANPDPDRTVPWGLQSHDEMLYGSFMFRWTEETAQNPVHDPLQFGIRQFFGFADKDMDGRLVRAEVWGGLARAWDKGSLKSADVNGDDALSFEEYYNMQLAQMKARRQNSR